MTPSGPLREQIHTLWDGIADFDASQVGEALHYLMRGLCAAVDAQKADWIGLVRLADCPNDPDGGWRPAMVRFFHSSDTLRSAVGEQTLRMDQRIARPGAGRTMAPAGRFRACRLCEFVPQEWLASDVCRACYSECDRQDAIYVASPVNEDAESHFGVFRANGQPPFTAQERDVLAYALRAIKWFHRQLMVSHGLLVAGTPLTDIERRVLRGLLTDHTESQIAGELAQSLDALHGHCAALYRKFAVDNRSALMTLWQGTRT